MWFTIRLGFLSVLLLGASTAANGKAQEQETNGSPTPNDPERPCIRLQSLHYDIFYPDPAPLPTFKSLLEGLYRREIQDVVGNIQDEFMEMLTRPAHRALREHWNSALSEMAGILLDYSRSSSVDTPDQVKGKVETITNAYQNHLAYAMDTHNVQKASLDDLYLKWIWLNERANSRDRMMDLLRGMVDKITSRKEKREKKKEL